MKYKILAAALLLAPLAYGQTPGQLQKQITALQATITSQNATIAALQRQVTLIAQNPALGLGPFVTVDPNPELRVRGPNITFHGANIHINSGTGATDDHGNPTGLGNLIIGADEVPNYFTTGDRSGSNNLVVGMHHRFTQTAFGGVVFGEYHSLSGEGNAILGGSGNTADGTGNVAVGGADNQVYGDYNVIVSSNGAFLNGGDLNLILGGNQDQLINGSHSTIVGGIGLIETGDQLTWSSAIIVQ